MLVWYAKMHAIAGLVTVNFFYAMLSFLRLEGCRGVKYSIWNGQPKRVFKLQIRIDRGTPAPEWWWVAAETAQTLPQLFSVKRRRLRSQVALYQHKRNTCLV